jgi:hypothetical protein
MLLIGLMEPDFMKLLGSPKPFLFFAGMAGVVYSFMRSGPTKMTLPISAEINWGLPLQRNPGEPIQLLSVGQAPVIFAP